MADRLLLTEPDAAGDLDTFLGRAEAIQDGSVRVITAGGVLAVYAPVLFPTSLLDESATVLGLRTFAIEGDESAVDSIVPIASLRARASSAAAVGEGFELGMPTPVYSVTWAGIVPPRGGWAPIGSVSSALLAEAAAKGIAEVAEAIPTNSGEAIVRSVRSLVWNEPIDGAEALPRGAAFAAQALGFLPPEGAPAEEGELFEVGPWTRLSLARGHVLVKRRAWSLAG